MLVDVRGGVGHGVQAIKEKNPAIPGRFVLQGVPSTIKQARLVPGMEAMDHDFFTPQPVKGELTRPRHT